jgi:hypothetical protein
MGRSVALIGVDPEELPWLRMLLQLMRHPDPTMSELVREALIYLAHGENQAGKPHRDPLDYAG